MTETIFFFKSREHGKRCLVLFPITLNLALRVKRERLLLRNAV